MAGKIRRKRFNKSIIHPHRTTLPSDTESRSFDKVYKLLPNGRKKSQDSDEEPPLPNIEIKLDSEKEN